VAAIQAPADQVRRTPADGFPALLTRHPAGEVYYCGWASRRSFGASSYLIVRPAGSVLIDSPRFNAPLARQPTPPPAPNTFCRGTTRWISTPPCA
jgi:hypothetical protein